MINYIKKISINLKIKKILKKNFIKYTHLKFNSYNGRNVTYTYYDKIKQSKYLIKFYLNKNYDIKKEIKLIEELKKNELIKYSLLFTDNKCYYIREYVIGTNLINNAHEVKSKSEKIVKFLIQYIYSVISLNNKNNTLYHLDFRLQNFILDQYNNINFIDTDISHKNYTFNYENNQGYYNFYQYKVHTFAKFIVKSFEKLSSDNSIIFFNYCSKFIDEIPSVKKIILLRFFQGYEKDSLDFFIYNNFNNFNDIDVTFDQKVSIDIKLAESLTLINKLKYVVARRYDWLEDEKKFRSKDIDIFCKKKDLLKIIMAFKDNGWDVYDNKISQYFDRYKTIVKIDLNTKLESNDKSFFNKLMINAEIKKGIKVIDELSYLQIIIKNSFVKKYLKINYFNEIENYFKKNKNSIISEYEYLLTIKKYKFKSFYYFSIIELIKRKIKDFVKNKKIIFIGADGAGKSTNVELAFNYLNNFVSVEKKYFGNFFFPSGRTNLLIFKTSIIFRIMIFFKNKSKKNKKIQYKNEIKKNDKKLVFLKSNTYQLFSIFFTPIFLFDIIFHKIITRITSSRFTICDRYYYDILLNYKSKKIRKFLSYLIGCKNYKVLFYASDQVHFNRKRQESLEMINYMNKIYEEFNYNLKINTGIPHNIVNKKVINFLINRFI